MWRKQIGTQPQSFRSQDTVKHTETEPPRKALRKIGLRYLFYHSWLWRIPSVSYKLRPQLEVDFNRKLHPYRAKFIIIKSLLRQRGGGHSVFNCHFSTYKRKASSGTFSGKIINGNKQIYLLYWCHFYTSSVIITISLLFLELGVFYSFQIWTKS